MKIEVTKESIHVDMRVVDNDGNAGTVKECHDIHNVLVKFDSGDEGFHCLVPECIEHINGIDVPHYDPLYEELS